MGFLRWTALSALFVVAILVGWITAGQVASEGEATPWAMAEFVELEDGVQVPTDAIAVYPSVAEETAPEASVSQDGVAARAGEIARTTSYLSGSPTADAELGDPSVGGQTFIRATVDGNLSAESVDGLVLGDAFDEVPTEVITSEPFLFPFLAELAPLTAIDPDPVTALDICAGMVPGATRPLGCPSGGFGGTIVATSLDTLEDVSISLAVPDRHPECSSDATTFRMRVIVNRPGTLTSIMWNYGPGTGNTLEQPPDSVFTSGATPEELNDQWYDDLEVAVFTTPRIQFCMEVPIRVNEGPVQHVVIFDSTHESDLEDPSDAAFGAFHYSSESPSARPPSGLSSLGRDTLYVRTFRASSEGTHTVVQARRLFPVRPTEPAAESEIEGCAPTFDGATPTEPTRLGTQGILMDTYDLTTAIESDDWPWGTEWDVMEVHGLPLHSSISYSICIYELDSDDRVVYAEAAKVWVPWARHVRVEVDAIVTGNVSPEPPIVSMTLDAAAQSQCWPYSVEWPGPSTVVVDFVGEDRAAPQVCVFQHTDGLRTNGGFMLETSLENASGESTALRHWITIDRSELRCAANCGPSEFLAFVPLPNVSSDGTERSAGEASVRISLGEPGGVESWTYGYPFPFIDDS